MRFSARARTAGSENPPDPTCARLERAAAAETRRCVRPAAQALDFLVRQGDDRGAARARLDALAPALRGRAEGGEAVVGAALFARLLDGLANSVWDPARRERRTDWGYMSRPLPSYWVDSSHNTYLVADQLASPASAEQYAALLARGVRCAPIKLLPATRIRCPAGHPGLFHPFSTPRSAPSPALQGPNAVVELHPYRKRRGGEHAN